MTSKISVDSLKHIDRKQRICALIDVREKSEFARGQIIGATNIPRHQLEFSILQKVPNKDIQIVLYDDDGSRALLAARTLEELGYTNVFYLEGGVNAWLENGNSLVEGVNRPCKAFGEKVAVNEKVPQIPAEELKKRLNRNERLIVIEVRPPGEVRRSGSIPGSVNIQGFDLVGRISDYIDKYDKIIVTCAGRTRGIISAQTLIKMGVKQVYDLEDGIMGWLLAGFELEKGISQGPRPSQKARKAAELFALRLYKENEISFISVTELQSLQQNPQGNILYLFDVRARDEYEAGHIPASVALPGGQAVQRADDFVAVWQGDIVFVSNNFARAMITAYWYRQMGFPNVHVLSGGIGAWTGYGLELETGLKGIEREPEDVYPKPYERGREAMERYLSWEKKLINT
ncbi:MAG: hypothetical protein K9J85_01335 [Desulfobacteraceae bacterium]|nr:hypothetical protein [Desulfobacteraceae bacterium]